jgi:FixJ family two-component response regulator
MSVSPQAKGTVFIVYDDASARTGLSRYVGCAGYTVQTFASANEFSQAPISREAVCLVADVRMRGGGGLLLAKQLREAGNPLPVILISADDGAEVRQRALALGAAGFFHKPVDGRALLDAIEWARTTRASLQPTGKGDSAGA